MAMIRGIPRKPLRDAATELDKTFLANGCLAYVKTIYIGYELDGEMIAAVYPRSDHLEVALAIPEDQEHELLRDASHLTWRTLPLAAVVTSKHDAIDIGDLLTMACSPRQRWCARRAPRQ